MNTKLKKITIIKEDSDHKEKLKQLFPISGYQLISIESSISSGIQSLIKECANLLILGLRLDDGEGIKIIEYIVNNIRKFKNLSYIFICSKYLDPHIEKEINELLHFTNIKLRFFRKLREHCSITAILNRLKIIENGVLDANSSNSDMSLKKAICAHFDEITFSKSSKSRPYLAYLIEFVIIKNLYNFKMDDLYEEVISFFKLESESKETSIEAIRKSIEQLLKQTFKKNPQAFLAYLKSTNRKKPSNKTFIHYMVNLTRETYPELCPKTE